MDVGVDSLCWHMRLASGAIRIEQVLEVAAELEVPVVAVNMPHVADRDLDGLRALADRGATLGVRLLAQGDFVGSPRHGDHPATGVSRIAGWVERAIAMRSPTVRVASGFYRADLASRPDLIDSERRYVTAVLLDAAQAASAAGVRLLLENHSDFTVDEYEAILEEVGPDRVGVWLDLINPLVTFDDPFRAIARLAPHAQSGHVRDLELRSIHQPDGYHRRGVEVLYRYPGEGAAPLAALLGALVGAVGERPYDLMIEGLDSRAEVDDQRERLQVAVAYVRRAIQQASA
jgi:sugar phosphate isomerase/epimerase